DLRQGVVQQRRQLGKPVQDLLQRLLVGVVERKLQLDVGQAVQRNRPDDVEVLDPGNLGFQRNRDVELDLLGRQARALGDDVDHRRRRVGIGLYVQLLERDKSPDDDGCKQPDHQKSATDCEGDEAI